MLIRHTLAYVFARGIPGLLNFFSVWLFTRELTPKEFGSYSVVVAYAVFLQVFLFQWLNQVVLRFSLDESGRTVLSNVRFIFACISIPLGLIGILFLGLSNQFEGLMKPGLAILLGSVLAWLELTLKIASINLELKSYGRILLLKSSISALTGYMLVLNGLGWWGPLIGIVVGSAASYLIAGRNLWGEISAIRPKKAELQRYWSYGFPFAITFGLGWVVSTSDRVIISLLIDDGAAGVYSVAYDLADQSIGLILVIINTAAYPLLIRQFDQGDQSLIYQQFKRNGELIGAVAVVSCAFFWAFGGEIAGLLVGDSFKDGVSTLLPWVAISAVISGFKAFYLDIVFQLMKKPFLQVYSAAVAATMNVGLNFALIPAFGQIGAVWATIISIGAGAIISYVLGRRIMVTPPVYPILGKALAVGGAFFLPLCFFKNYTDTDAAGSFFAILAAITFLASAVWLSDLCELRALIKKKVRG
jgi:O-antigen/teichoic acid export membrane protein